MAQQTILGRLDPARAVEELPAGCDTAALAACFATMLQGMAVQAHDGRRWPRWCG